MRYKISLILLVILLLAFNLYADTIEEKLKRTEANLKKLEGNRGALLSPKNFEKAKEKYNKAQDNYNKGKNIKDIEKNLQESETAIKDANKVIELANIAFAEALVAREDAETVNAPDYATEEYEKAASKFSEAILKLEGGNLDSAKKKGAEAENLYRNAELSAIKANTIGTAQSIIKEAKDAGAEKYAPRTYNHSKNLAAEAENILNTDRYAGDEAQRKAEQSIYEAKHAIYITRKAKIMEGDKANIETLFLENEELVGRVALAMDIEAKFDEGLEKPTSTMTQIIKNMREENVRLNKEIVEKNGKIEKLRNELNEAKNELAKLKGEYEYELEQKRLELEAKKREEEKIAKVDGLFNEDEAEVLLDGTDLVIRLRALQFPPGKAVIPPEAYYLFSKVISSIQEYPDNELIIEGHTDSQGRDASNQLLSEKRAQAVRTYLLANNPNLSVDLVSAMGYGENRPIASNDTKDGRAQNRRIDLVIRNAKTYQ